jgi:hypothetical protein
VFRNELTPWGRVHLEKLIVTQLVKKFLAQLVKKLPAFYGTRRFITVFRRPALGPYPEPDESIPTN